MNAGEFETPVTLFEGVETEIETFGASHWRYKELMRTRAAVVPLKGSPVVIQDQIVYAYPIRLRVRVYVPIKTPGLVIFGTDPDVSDIYAIDSVTAGVDFKEIHAHLVERNSVEFWTEPEPPEPEPVYNIMRGTANFGGSLLSAASGTMWYEGRFRTASGGTGTRTIVRLTDAPVAGATHMCRQTNAKVQSLRVTISQDYVLPTNHVGEWTLSCYYRGGVTLRLYVFNHYKNVVEQEVAGEPSEEWARASLTWSSDGVTCESVFVGINGADIGTVEVCAMMINRGTEPQEYTPIAWNGQTPL